MKVVPQYKVIGKYNYDRIIHSIEKMYAKRQDIWKIQLTKVSQFVADNSKMNFKFNK